MRGTAGLDQGLADAEHDYLQAEQELNAAVQAFTGLEDVASARERLLALREQRDTARERLEDLQAATIPAVSITASGDWDRLTLDEQRALIAAVIERADVGPGRGADRITVKPRGE